MPRLFAVIAFACLLFAAPATQAVCIAPFAATEAAPPETRPATPAEDPKVCRPETERPPAQVAMLNPDAYTLRQLTEVDPSYRPPRRNACVRTSACRVVFTRRICRADVSVCVNQACTCTGGLFSGIAVNP